MHSTYVASSEVALVHGCLVYTERASHTNFHPWQKGEKMHLLFDWIKYLAVIRALTMFGCIKNTYDVKLY